MLSKSNKRGREHLAKRPLSEGFTLAQNDIEMQVEITNDEPTEAERKALENFFDWLLAEVLEGMDKAA